MKAFLSSTYLDLVECRPAAGEAIQRLDAQVGAMEVFGARPAEAKGRPYGFWRKRSSTAGSWSDGRKGRSSSGISHSRNTLAAAKLAVLDDCWDRMVGETSVAPV